MILKPSCFRHQQRINFLLKARQSPLDNSRSLSISELFSIPLPQTASLYCSLFLFLYISPSLLRLRWVCFLPCFRATSLSVCQAASPHSHSAHNNEAFMDSTWLVSSCCWHHEQIFVPASHLQVFGSIFCMCVLRLRGTKSIRKPKLASENAILY